MSETRIETETPVSELSDRDLLEEIAQNMRDVRALVDGTLSEVKPTLDQLMNHPMFKMMFGGKK